MVKEKESCDKVYKGIKRKYLYSIFLFLLFFILRQYLIDYQTQKYVNTITYISSLKEQAILSQNILKNAELFMDDKENTSIHEKLNTELLDWEKNSKSIIDMNTGKTAIKTNSDIIANLKKIEKYRSLISEDIRNLIKGEISELPLVLYQNDDNYMGKIEEVIRMYKLEGEKQFAYYELMDNSLFILLFVFIIFNILVFMLPGEKKMTRLFDELHLCNKNLLSLFMSAHGALFIVKKSDLEIIIMNEEAKRIIQGYTTTDKTTMYDVVEYLEFLTIDKKVIFDKLNLEESIINYEIDIRTAEGNIYTFLLSTQKGTYSRDDVILINLVEITEQKKNEETMKKLALKDELTGLYNRHFLENIIPDEIKRADKDGYPVSVIMVDLDFFKRINDRCGHPIGDSVLQQTAAIIYENIRNSDYLIRIGGEEFLIFMPYTNLNGALVAAEKLRYELEKNDHPIAGRYTASFGVAQRLEGEGYIGLYNRVDEALYRAKRSGRNCVISAKEIESSESASKFLQWKHEWNSGNKLIDDEHKELVDIANSLINITYIPDNMEKELEQLDNLIVKITEHFNDEERILKEIKYPDYDEHVKEHKSLLEIASHIRDICIKGELNLVYVHSFVVDQMIKEHLLQKDVDYFPYLNKE